MKYLFLILHLLFVNKYFCTINVLTLYFQKSLSISWLQYQGESHSLEETYRECVEPRSEVPSRVVWGAETRRQRRLKSRGTHGRAKAKEPRSPAGAVNEIHGQREKPAMTHSANVTTFYFLLFSQSVRKNS